MILNRLVRTLVCVLACFGVASTANAAMFIYLQGTNTAAPSPVNCGSVAVGSSVLCPGIDFQYASSDYLTADAWRNLSTAISNTAEFAVASSTCVLNSTRGSGLACRVQLRYSPTSGGSHATSFTLNGQERTYQDNPGANRSYSFSASGTLPVTYDWSTGTWAAWSSSCSSNATRVRTVTCMQNGTTPVADSLCTASKPEASETSEVLTGCTYQWSAQTWSGCTGGSGEWMPGEWVPATGCGTTQQLRSVACSVNLDSGAMTRDVNCVRSDGATVADAQCAQAKPAGTQPCTPTTNVCDASPATEQTVQLDSDCSSEGGDEDETETPPGPTPVKKELCAPDAASHKYCVWMPL